MGRVISNDAVDSDRNRDSLESISRRHFVDVTVLIQFADNPIIDQLFDLTLATLGFCVAIRRRTLRKASIDGNGLRSMLICKS